MDGDGEKDYVVLILLSEREKPWHASLIALFSRDTSFEIVPVMRGENGQNIFTTDYPYDLDEYSMAFGEGREAAIEACIARMEEFIPFDAVGISYHEKQPRYLVWDKEEKFVSTVEIEERLCKDLYDS